MKLIPLKSPLIKPGVDIIDKIIQILKRVKIANGDVLIIASKVIAISQNRLLDLEKVLPTPQALKLAVKYKIEPEFAQVIINEADEILGGVVKAVLTSKKGFLVANAGVDHSNTPANQIVLWPHNPIRVAEQIKNVVQKRRHKKIGVIISDSHCIPRRLGTCAQAIAVAGFQGVDDIRGKKDLFKRKTQITQMNIADSLASAANLLMGETAKKIPLVLIKKAPIKLTRQKASILTKRLQISREACLFRDY